MTLQFYPNHFSSLLQVMEDVKKNGTWPTTFVSGASPGLEPHWHSEEVHAYIMEGATDFYDQTTDRRTAVKAGDKIIVPARTIHAEGAVKDRVVYILALPKPLSPDEFLKMNAPDTL